MSNEKTNRGTTDESLDNHPEIHDAVQEVDLDDIEDLTTKAKDDTDEAQDVLPDEYFTDVELLEEKLDDVYLGVDDLQDGDPAGLHRAIAAIETVDGRIERLQDEVGFDNPEHARVLEAIDDDQEAIEDAIEGLTHLGSVHPVYVNGSFVAAYADDTVQGATILAHAGKTPVNDYLLQALDDAPDDGGEPVAEFGHDDPVDLDDGPRTHFETFTDGGGKA